MSADNENLIDATAFARMRRRPVLINCARGSLIDEVVLNGVLNSGQISGAGLDVLADEPPNFADLKLAERNNFILTPHLAYYSGTSPLECRKKSAGNIRHFLDGRHQLVGNCIFQADR
jgi:phosphoglycerate dehydrogenase-like enzyme